MEEVGIVGVDLAWKVLWLHGAAAEGSVVFRKKLSRPQFARFAPVARPGWSESRTCRAGRKRLDGRGAGG